MNACAILPRPAIPLFSVSTVCATYASHLAAVSAATAAYSYVTMPVSLSPLISAHRYGAAHVTTEG